jgi:hypothetical protein
MRACAPSKQRIGDHLYSVNDDTNPSVSPPLCKGCSVQAEIFLNLEFSLQYSDSQAGSLATETWTKSWSTMARSYSYSLGNFYWKFLSIFLFLVSLCCLSFQFILLLFYPPPPLLIRFYIFMILIFVSFRLKTKSSYSNDVSYGR